MWGAELGVLFLDLAPPLTVCDLRQSTLTSLGLSFLICTMGGLVEDGLLDFLTSQIFNCSVFLKV